MAGCCEEVVLLLVGAGEVVVSWRKAESLRGSFRSDCSLSKWDSWADRLD